jgi:hypothetical protein
MCFGGDLVSGSKIFCGAEGADDCGDVALVGVDLGVEMAHVGGGEFAG